MTDDTHIYSSPVPTDTPSRISTTILPPDSQTPNFIIDAHQKSYRHQYSNIYYIRLHHLRPVVEEHAREKWSEIEGASTSVRCKSSQTQHFIGNPQLVSRVLDVDKGKICYVIGTVYMEMPLKPNVMEDIARDVCVHYSLFSEIGSIYPCL